MEFAQFKYSLNLKKMSVFCQLVSLWLQTLLTEWKVRRIHINIDVYFGNAKLFQYDSTLVLSMQY